MGGGFCPRCLLQLAIEPDAQPSAMPFPDIPRPPDRLESIGAYRVIRQLGEGGMGVVYLAEQTEPVRRQVALKVIKPGHSTHAAARFSAERQMLATLNHPGISQIFDAGTTSDGRPYVVMEYVDGLPITRFADERRLPVRDRLALFVKVCAAVQHAHQKGIIHRDLKPSNLLVSDTAGETGVKVIDFGIAKALEPADGDQPPGTQTGVLLGTPEYASPEQITGRSSAAVDARSDVYALGVVLYELLAGVRPIEIAPRAPVNPLALLDAMRAGNTPTLTARLTRLGAAAADIAARRQTDIRQLCAELRGELEWISRRALMPQPDDRYSSVAELAADVERFLAGTRVLAHPPSLIYRGRMAIRRRRGVVAAMVMLVVVGVAYGGGLLTVGYSSRGAAAAPASPIIRSVLVLPLANASSDSDQAYVAAGITDMLTTDLSRVGSLRVVARTTAAKYQRLGTPLAAIGREVGIDAVVQGSVARTGNRLRVAARLIAVNPERQLWADTYEREIGDVLPHAELAQAVATAIQATLLPEDHARLRHVEPVRAEAWDAFLRARYYESGAAGLATERAIASYEKAVELDPTFTAARAGLSRAYIFGVRLQPKEALARAREIAKTALARDPESPDALLASAVARLYYDRDFRGSDEEFRRAVDGDPGSADAHFYHSQCLVAMGRFDEALAAARRAQSLDPMSPLIAHYIGRIHYFARDYDRAIEALDHALDLDPNYAFTHIIIAAARERMHDYDRALEHRQAYWTLTDKSPEAVAEFARVARGRGYGAALQLWAHQTEAEARQRGYFTSTELALLYAEMGRSGEALRALERATADGVRDLIYLNVEPAFDALRGSSEFSAVVTHAIPGGGGPPPSGR